MTDEERIVEMIAEILNEETDDHKLVNENINSLTDSSIKFYI